MPIPTYEDLMLPLLKSLADGRERTLAELRARLAAELNLSKDDLEQLIPSGRITTFSSRVHWAKGYLQKAGAVESPRRGVARITERGLLLMQAHPQGIRSKDLEQFTEFLAWLGKSARPDDEARTSEIELPSLDEDALTPEEAMQKNFRELKAVVQEEMLQSIRANVTSLL